MQDFDEMKLATSDSCHKVETHTNKGILSEILVFNDITTPGPNNFWQKVKSQFNFLSTRETKRPSLWASPTSLVLVYIHWLIL